MKNITYTFFTVLMTCFCMSSLSAQCISNAHSPFKNQGWMSCETNPSPNSARGTGHWLLYDLGHIYNLDSAYVWNHNVWGETENGVREILIDYSMDQVTWQTLGPFTIEKAPGSWKYNTPQGLWMGDALGRYFLVTVLRTWDNNDECAGFGEVRFTLNEIVDTDEEILTDSWSLSPNPASDFVSIDLAKGVGSTQISVLNNLGQEVYSTTALYGQKTRIDVEHFEDGMYFVRLNTEGVISSRPFVKVD